MWKEFELEVLGKYLVQGEAKIGAKEVISPRSKIEPIVVEVPVVEDVNLFSIQDIDTGEEISDAELDGVYDDIVDAVKDGIVNEILLINDLQEGI